MSLATIKLRKIHSETGNKEKYRSLLSLKPYSRNVAIIIWCCRYM